MLLTLLHLIQLEKSARYVDLEVNFITTKIRFNMLYNNVDIFENRKFTSHCS